MSTTTSVSTAPAKLVARRGELIAELFLQELEPAFVAQPETDFAYDFFIGFSKPDGGLNTYAVEVHATAQPVNGKFRMPAEQYRRLANSNIPVLLLIVDVKRNRLFYAWPDADSAQAAQNAVVTTVPVTEINDKTRANLRKRLAD